MKAPTKICRLLALFGWHAKNCSRCGATENHGRDMLKRLEELSAKTNPSTEEKTDKVV